MNNQQQKPLISNPIFSQIASSSPLYQRAQEMANGKSTEELEQVAKNLCEQKGISFDDAYKAFTQMLNK